MIRRKAIDDLKEAFSADPKSETDLTVGVTQRIKSIFKDSVYLKCIPPAQRIEVSLR